MTTTPTSLLQRIRQATDQAAWRQFVLLYTPLLFYWVRRLGLQDADAVELVQEVLAELVRKLPKFHPDRDRRFRDWLRTILLTSWREKCRPAMLPREGDDRTLTELPLPDGIDPLAEPDYRQHLVGRALQLMRPEFQQTTWKAYWEVVVAGRPASEVAAELGISLGAVHAARARVLRRLREELAELLD